jgi:hypothetical protein
MGHDLMHGHIHPLFIKTGILLEKFGRLLRWSVNWILTGLVLTGLQINYLFLFVGKI